MWLLLLLDDYRIADIILLMLLTKVKVTDLENSMMFMSKFYVKFLSFACYTFGIRNMQKGYIVFLHSVSPLVCLSLHPSVHLSHSITKFYFEVF